MNKRNLLPALLIVLAILLAGCKTSMSSELFFRDLNDLPDGELTNKVVFHLPLASADKCEEYRERYDKVFTKSDDFKDMEYVQCVDGDLNDDIEYELDVPLRLTDPSKGTMKGAVELIRYSDEDAEELRFVFIRVNPPSLHNLDELLYEEFYQRLDLSETSPLFRISNDMRSDQVFIVQHVFVQNEPVITATAFTLEPRDSIDVGLSDVTSTWIFYVSEDADPRFAPIGLWTTPDDDEE
jgi:hypothetical protein